MLITCGLIHFVKSCRFDIMVHAQLQVMIWQNYYF